MSHWDCLNPDGDEDLRWRKTGMNRCGQLTEEHGKELPTARRGKELVSVVLAIGQ